MACTSVFCRCWCWTHLFLGATVGTMSGGSITGDNISVPAFAAAAAAAAAFLRRRRLRFSLGGTNSIKTLRPCMRTVDQRGPALLWRSATLSCVEPRASRFVGATPCMVLVVLRRLPASNCFGAAVLHLIANHHIQLAAIVLSI